MKIDTHQHAWNLAQVDYPWLKPEYTPFYGNFTPDLLAPQVKAAGIDYTVMVQAANSYEDTASMLLHADYNDWIAGIVGWMNLLDPEETGKRLDIYTRGRYFKGMRHLIHDEPDPDWVIQDVVLESLTILAAHNLPFDVVAVYPNHLPHVPTLADKIPNLRMVIDHLGKPPIGRDEPAWFDLMSAAAEAPNVYAKLSGQFDNARWTVEDVQPYVDHVLEQFGANRVMFGSDWPVALQGGTYASVWSNTQQLIAGCSPDEQAAILGGTAIQFYNLNV
ncbi:MAG: amidohydrolase family protein [Anaerolineae bacterium]|nr:amidohydrolase family protein [Anaerolineae bacterium]